MKRYFTFMLAIGLAMGITIEANAITTGRWNFSGIHEAIQNVAEDAPVQDSKPVHLPAYLLEQVHKAKDAQRITARWYWNNR